MTEFSAETVKQLREKTGVGMMDCKRALEETGGDLEKAVDLLRKKGLAKAEKRAGRATKQGLVYSYIHTGGTIGVMIELNCESDFVARTDGFVELAKNIALHVAASNPLALDRASMPEAVVAREKAIHVEAAAATGKPAAILEKIAEGKMAKFYEDNCLLEQKFIKDPDRTIQELLNEAIAKMGENIALRRFVRYQLGEEL
jgi:elongation factor Ts